MASDRPVHTVSVVTADGATGNQFESLTSLLADVRRLLRMDVVFVSQFLDGRRYFRHVQAQQGGGPVPRVGDSDALEDTYCHRIVRGRLPQVIPDTGALQEAAGLAVTHALEIGSYIGVPIRLKNGELYGTLCCFSRAPDPRLSSAAAAKLRGVAKAVAVRLQQIPDVNKDG